MSSASKLRRLTRQALEGDELAALLADALRFQLRGRNKGEGAVKVLAAAEACVHNQYSDPANWESKGILQIIYLEEATGLQTTVGTFQEFVHRRTEARKLSRVDSDMPLRCEGYNTVIEKDPYLVRFPEDPCPPSPPQNAYERQAIRDYLARTKDQPLDEALGVSKVDAAKLLKQLRDMGVERFR